MVYELKIPQDLRWSGEQFDAIAQHNKDLQTKMQEYIENGVRLGWLIEPEAKVVEIYRPGTAKQVLNPPQTLCADPI